MELFYGARLFDPTYAEDIDRHQEAMLLLLDKMRCYPLKNGWRAYKQIASLVLADFDKDDDAAILSWHGKMYLHLDVEKSEDNRHSKCRYYCSNKSNNCKCNDNLRAWWKAAMFAALVMPSSGAAENVFSLLNNLFNDQQSSLLGDAIFLSLYLSHDSNHAIFR
eukprot:scaffold48451_cov73-Attheya_sp.AAC.2